MVLPYPIYLVLYNKAVKLLEIGFQLFLEVE
ncbi:hypothetical protein J2X77_000895 [Sphingobacterium sp. 2149]|nr:hypothetical protein [Sphingobacterium sp. 2149]